MPWRSWQTAFGVRRFAKDVRDAHQVTGRVPLTNRVKTHASQQPGTAVAAVPRTGDLRFAQIPESRHRPGYCICAVASVSTARPRRAHVDDVRARAAGLLWRLLRHGEGGVCAATLSAPSHRPQRAVGYPGNDTIRADDGNVQLAIDCDGSGPDNVGTADVAYIDANDPEPTNCETVIRSGGGGAGGGGGRGRDSAGRHDPAARATTPQLTSCTAIYSRRRGRSPAAHLSPTTPRRGSRSSPSTPRRPPLWPSRKLTTSCARTSRSPVCRTPGRSTSTGCQRD
jgi:hypothetical protein